MSGRGFKNLFRWITSPVVYQPAVLVITSVLAFVALIVPIAIRPSAFPLKIGDVATQDIQAPYALEYVSDTLTEQARVDARNAVSRVYLVADPTISRRQIERLRVALNYISNVRFDAYASEQQKLTDLDSLTDIKLTPLLAGEILSINESRWQNIQQESLAVLEQVMRKTIRDDQLGDARRSIPTLVSFSLPEDQASIVNDLVFPFVVPNSLYSEEQTQTARTQASDAVQPVKRTFVAGESIVRRGQLITPATWEALGKFGLIRPLNQSQNMLSSGLLVALLAVFIGLYLGHRHLTFIQDFRSLLLVSGLFLAFLYGARFIIPNRAVIPYLFPLAAFSITIASLFTLEMGLVLSIPLGILVAYGLDNSLDLTLFYILSSACAILILGRAHRIANFFWSGIAVGLTGSAVVLAYRLPAAITDWVGLATLSGSAFINGIASAGLALLLQFLVAQLLGLTTALQLLEISRPDQPLLQHMLRNAPGSYQHSLQVANLAEQAAEVIGADALLTRVGALYHDVGKTANPQFFIENQVAGKLNPHDDLDPITSAATIIRHVSDGLQLARKHRLPPRIQDFIAEHHGTNLARYQYTRAVQAAGDDPAKVDQSLFRYPGPRPRSKETALLMLADGCEARARAELPKNEEELRAVVRKVIDHCEREGQLDDTGLTLHDLRSITETFVSTLRNNYHSRIQYPELKSAGAASNQETTPNKG